MTIENLMIGIIGSLIASYIFIYLKRLRCIEDIKIIKRYINLSHILNLIYA